MSDELKKCGRCEDHVEYYSASETLCVQCTRTAGQRLAEAEAKLAIAVESLEEIRRNQYISAIVDEAAKEALAKIRS